MEEKHRILNQYFGYSSFRDGQEALIDAQLAGRDVFGIMPTGGGKSLCYQIPALLLEGITLVVSPLISLMKDQVASLKKAGIPAAFLNSSLSTEQARAVYKNLLSDQYKILYIAPERLATEGFLTLARKLKISLLAVDEAHCISQWGQDFRPSYLRIVTFLNALGYRPVVSAFTATATTQVREDVERILELRDPLRVVTGYDRPNLRFEVRKPKNKPAALLDLVRERNDKSGIVYCSTRKEVEKVCQMLQEKGIPATRYHAGLTEKERRENQDRFLYDECTVMAATNAFGMGIDKSNVGYVIHYNMPQSMEAYYQEAGRAGRDGEAADCILLFAPKDIETARFLILHPSENEELSEAERRQITAQALARLDKMEGYCKTTGCLRAYILDYFGESHRENCGNCGNCDREFTETDITTQAKMILSCVARMHDRLGYFMGMSTVIQVLRGKGDKRILSLGLDKLSTYGLMPTVSQEKLRGMVECLIDQGYLKTDPEHRGLILMARAGDVLFRGEAVKMKVAGHVAPALPKPAAPGEEEALFTALKALRMRLAERDHVPAYIVFTNATLQDMARKRPTTMEAFLEVSGVGKYKAEQYGKIFLEEIRKFLDKE